MSVNVGEQRLQWSANVAMAPFRHGAAVSSGGGGALSIQKGRFYGLFTCLSRLRRDVSSGSYRLLESCYQKSASVSASEHSDFALSLGGKKANFTNKIHPSERWLQYFFFKGQTIDLIKCWQSSSTVSPTGLYLVQTLLRSSAVPQMVWIKYRHKLMAISLYCLGFYVCALLWPFPKHNLPVDKSVKWAERLIVISPMHPRLWTWTTDFQPTKLVSHCWVISTQNGSH